MTAGAGRSHGVLLVEDSPGDARLVSVMLHQETFGSFALTHVGTVGEALAALRAGTFACVLLDLSLPDSDGLDGLGAIRAAHPAVPVVVLTGSGDSLACAALRGGAQDFLEKDSVNRVLLQRALRYAVERARVESTLRERDRQLATSHRLARMGTWEWRVDDGSVSASPELRAVLGLPADAGPWDPDTALAFIHEADRPAVVDAISAALAGAGDFFFTARLVIGSTVVTGRHVGETRRGADGCGVTVFATMQDVTELGRAEAALRASERRYRTIVETAEEGVWAVGDGQVTTFANRRLAEILGHRPDTLRGRHVRTVVDEAAWPAVAEALARSRAGETTTCELTLRRADGRAVRVHAAMSPVWEEEGGPPSVLAIVNDITERYDAEQALRLDHDVVVELATAADVPGALRAAAAHVAPVVGAGYVEVWHRPPGGRHVQLASVAYSADDAYASLTAETRAVRLLPGEDVVGSVWESGAPVLGGWSAGSACARAAAGTGLAQAYVMPVRARGTVAVVVWYLTGTDVPPLVADTLATLGQRLDDFALRCQVEQMKDTFLTALSHELRTPLTAVLGLATTLQQHHDRLDPGQRGQCVDGVVRNATRLNTLLADLLDVDRLARGVLDPRPRSVRLDDLVRDVARAFDADLARTTLDLAPCVANVDAPKVERIVENLLANAAKYTPAATPITVRLTVEDDTVVLAVDDRGPGVSDELKSAIFEPFRRGDGLLSHAPGTGIGLSLVAGFARLHGGHAWVEDRPDGGASFRVSLPAAHPVPHQQVREPRGGDAVARGAR